MPTIHTEGPTKYYGLRRGIVGIDLSIDGWEVFVFLGPNGAGKTTTIRLLLDLIRRCKTRRVYRRANAALPDSIHGIKRNNALMTYAVVVSEDDGPEHVGRLEFERDCVRLAGGSAVRYDDLRDVYVERRSGGSTTASRPTLVLISRQGERLRIGSLEGLGALHELAEKVAEARGKAAG